ncbi:hypothetical protein D3C76_1700660 [compost metagenome]
MLPKPMPKGCFRISGTACSARPIRALKEVSASRFPSVPTLSVSCSELGKSGRASITAPVTTDRVRRIFKRLALLASRR